MVSSDPCGMARARSAGGGAAGSVARVSVSRGEASGSWPARAGPGIFTRVERRRSEHKGMWIRNRKERTGGAAAGRAGSFNSEEQRSSRFRSYGPPLREERLFEGSRHRD